jgi:hypothetical protein
MGKLVLAKILYSNLFAKEVKHFCDYNESLIAFWGFVLTDRKRTLQTTWGIHTYGIYHRISSEREKVHGE